MVDCLLDYSADHTQVLTELTIREDNFFYQEGYLSEYGLIENIAQSCAAKIGYHNLESGAPIRIGMIGAINDLQVQALPRLGEKITTEIFVLSEVFAITLARATVRYGEKSLAECKIKIAIR